MTTSRLRSPLSTIALAGLIGFGLFRFAPAVSQLRAGLPRPHAWIEQVGPDAALASFAGALLWGAALWLAIGLLAAVLSRLPGRPGSLAGAFARLALPVAVRSVVIASTGASLLISPVAAIAAGPAAGGQQVATASTPFWPLDQPDRPLPAPGWPTLSGSVQAPPTPATTADPTGAGTAGPAMPSGSSTPSHSAGPATSTAPPASSPVTTTPSAPAPPASTRPAPAGSVTVQPGDSLWTIAAQQLGTAAQASRITVEWPYWYRANRKIIGNDPSLLHPGTELLVPDQATDSGR